MKSRGRTPPALTPAERNALVSLAREALRLYLETGRILDRAPPEAPRRRAGLFVTLREGAKLQGCIGWITSDEPLHRTVVHCAIAAATEDPRFEPLRAEDLAKLSIQISVLSPLIPVASPEEILVGRDGLVVEKEGRRGLLLPQVAVEQDWGRDALLEEVCRKAGLPPGAWRRDATLHRFTAEVFEG